MIVISFLCLERMVEQYSVRRTDGLTCTVDVRYTNTPLSILRDTIMIKPPPEVSLVKHFLLQQSGVRLCLLL